MKVFFLVSIFSNRWRLDKNRLKQLISDKFLFFFTKFLTYILEIKQNRLIFKMSHSLLMKVISSSITSANRAGLIIRDVMKKGELGIVDKGINDLQTEADRSAQRCIVASLSKLYPNVKIIGEEGVLENIEVNK